MSWKMLWGWEETLMFLAAMFPLIASIVGLSVAYFILGAIRNRRR